MGEGELGGRGVGPGASATGLTVAKGTWGSAETPVGVAGGVEDVSKGETGREEAGAGAGVASSGAGVTGLESGSAGESPAVGSADEKGAGGVISWDVGGSISGVAGAGRG